MILRVGKDEIDTLAEMCSVSRCEGNGAVNTMAKVIPNCDRKRSDGVRLEVRDEVEIVTEVNSVSRSEEMNILSRYEGNKTVTSMAKVIRNCEEQKPGEMIL